MIVAGIGMRRQAQQAQLRAALKISLHPISALACLHKHAVQLQPLADQMGLRLFLLRDPQIAGVPTRTHSARIHARFMTGSVAEATALTALGPKARLIVPRWISPCGHVTVALAEGPTQ